MDNRNVKNSRNNRKRSKSSARSQRTDGSRARTAGTVEQNRRSTEISKSHAARRSQKKGIGSAVITVLVIATLIALVLFLFFAVFRIKSVKFSGKDSIYSEKQVLSAAGIEMNSSYFGVDADRIKENIEKTYPDIGEIKVEKKAPSSVIIKDIGYGGLIDLDTANGHVLLDESGKVNRIIKTSLDGMTVVEGIELSSFDLSKPAVFKDGELGENLAAVRSALREAKLDKINKISFEKDGGINLTYDNRITLALGNISNVNEKIARAKIIVTEENNEKAKGTLDLSINGNAYFKPE